MRRRRGGPGILSTMAQTAVIAGTANATVNVMNSKAAAKQQAAHQQATAAQSVAEEVAATQARLAALEQQAAAAAAPQPAVVEAPVAPAGDDVIARLQQLAELHRSGILSDSEFEKAKGLVLGN
jgi:putative oligomerization/nucleic acid binding protein